MIQLDDIHRHQNADPVRKQALEKQFQDNSLDYLASVAAEDGLFSEADLSKLNARIDRASGVGSYGTGLFISLLCGLLIGVSVFFILFQKSQNHASVSMPMETTTSPLSLNNAVKPADTTFNQPAPAEKPFAREHFASIQDVAAPPPVPSIPAEVPTTLDPVAIPATIPETPPADELALKFVPNAPVIFIHDLKITNYRQYYFNHDQKIGVSDNSGVAAQYDSKTEPHASSLPQEAHYYAHEEIRDAMLKFNQHQYAKCIHDLQNLLELNSEDVNALFYSGMGYFYLNNDAKAIEFLDKVLHHENNIFHQEAAFYKAQALWRSHRTEEATDLLKSIQREKGFYSQRATEWLAAPAKTP